MWRRIWIIIYRRIGMVINSPTSSKTTTAPSTHLQIATRLKKTSVPTASHPARPLFQPLPAAARWSEIISIWRTISNKWALWYRADRFKLLGTRGGVMRHCHKTEETAKATMDLELAHTWSHWDRVSTSLVRGSSIRLDTMRTPTASCTSANPQPYTSAKDNRAALARALRTSALLSLRDSRRGEREKKLS